MLENLTEADAAIVSTDYTSHLVVEYCVPSEANCGKMVDIFSRAKFAGPELIQDLDKLVEDEIGLDLSKFFFEQNPNVTGKRWSDKHGSYSFKFTKT